MTLAIFLIPLFVTIVLLFGGGYIRIRKARHRRRTMSADTVVVGIFHPYCDAGGGGERVLYVMLRRFLMEPSMRHLRFVIYTGDQASWEEILGRAATRFGAGSDLRSIPDVRSRVKFQRLRRRHLIEASTWPHFTLLGQSLGSMAVGAEALARSLDEDLPDVFLDTMGYAFTFPLAKWWAGARVGAYVHYPTISSDMLNKVVERRPDYNNDARVAGSVTASTLKYVYYLLFARLYGMMGRRASVVAVNSTWTMNHIREIWGIDPVVIYPPCLLLPPPPPVSSESEEKRENVIVSIAQFRPEKDHRLQLASLRTYLDDLDERRGLPHVKLVMMGSCRDEGDYARLEDLRRYARDELSLNEGSDFEFLVNASRPEIERRMRTGLIGMHTMWNEHFGIGVVEMMAAGLIVIAHDSGGPRKDIVRRGETGFLAAERREYADAIREIMSLSPDRLDSIRSAAKTDVFSRFTEEKFGDDVVRVFRDLWPTPKRE